MVNLLFRTVDFRMFLKEIAEKAGSAILLQLGQEKFPKLTSDDFSLRIEPWHLTIQHLQFLINNESNDAFVSVLISHIIQVGIVPEGTSLFTSDNPVVRQSHLTNPILSMTGLASPGIEVALPISSKSIILLRERTHFSGESARENFVISLSQDDVGRLNSLQVKQARRQLYARTNTGFDLAKEIIARDPTFADPERARINIAVSNDALHIKPTLKTAYTR